jgi:RNA polymerase sigma-70 factor, ECF subfamily
VDAAHDRELADLLRRAQGGDGEAYRQFLTGSSALLRGFLRRRVREPEAAEDVLQETLLSIHRARHTWLPTRPVGPWLYAICEHRIADFFRRHRRVEPLELAAEPAAAEPDGPPVLEALGQLPPRQRRVIELLKLHDLSVKEVAAEVGMSESAVKVTAFRGYQAMRKLFGVKP